jgi:Ca-activated chloride channel family protein
MHFARAEYLHLFWLLPLLAVFFAWTFRRRRRRLEKLVSPAITPRLTEEFSRGKAVLRAFLLLGCFAFIILALARPQWGLRLETVRRRGVDILVALDTSYSMNAEDVAPTRLAKAKAEIRSLLARLKGDRIGLISFAGSAVVQCPLTLDYGAINLFLDIASTDSIPDPGTSLAAAITTANSAFVAGERKYKVLIILTDGEDLEGQVDSAVEKAKETGVMIYAIGIGSSEGRPIPMRDDKGNVVEYRKDPNGQVVISRLDEKALAQIAIQTGGRYFRASTAEGELDDLYDEVSQMDKKELESKLYQNFEDRFQYPLTAAVILLAVEALLSEKKRAGTGRLDKIARRWRTDQGSRKQ